jgi:hypothetical protein
MSILEVVANLSAAVEPAGTQRLIAGCSYRRNTVVGEITGWTENGAGKRIAVAFDATGISADVKALKILRVGRANRKKRKNKHTGARYESVQNTPHLKIRIVSCTGGTRLLSALTCLPVVHRGSATRIRNVTKLDKKAARLGGLINTNIFT